MLRRSTRSAARLPAALRDSGCAVLGCAVVLGFAVAILGCGAERTTDGVDVDVDVDTDVDWKASSEGQVIIATVGGEPIYDTCVAEHLARAADITHQDALDECVAFELLAQEARRRGYANAEAAEAQKREAVRAMIDDSFYARFASPADVPVADVRVEWERGAGKYYNRLERRATFYCRAINPDDKGFTPDGEPAAKAKIVAEAFYAELRKIPNLTRETMTPICRRIVSEIGGAKVSMDTFETALRGPAVPEYAQGVFKVPRVGTVTPPIRTGWGWDVILVTEIDPAASHTFEEATPLIQKRMFETEFFEGYRRMRFERFVATIVKSVPVELYEDNLGPGLSMPTSASALPNGPLRSPNAGPPR